MNEKLIKQLREGTIAIGNYSTLEEIRKVLRYAFPLDNRITNGLHLKYIASNDEDFWVGVDTVNLPTHSVKEFLKPENEYPKVMKVSFFPINTKKEFEKANTRVVFMEKCGKYIAWNRAETLEEAEETTITNDWDYAVDLDWQPEEETKPLKLTIEQIAQKFNVEKIEIVNYENKD